LQITSGTSGPLTTDDALNLYFGVPLQYRRRGDTRFIMNDTSHQRFRAIATGLTGDDRLLFGMDVGSYQLFRDSLSRVVINDTITNSQIAFGSMRRYRMYRSAGITLGRTPGRFYAPTIE
jgi:HK97 family phage major capsid protein